MSWETRNGRGRYYTRSRRRGGKVVREYFGAGEMAGLVAQMDAVDRTNRRSQLVARRSRMAKADAFDAAVAVACDPIELLARAALVVAGYRQHRRGEWRKRRAERSS